LTKVLLDKICENVMFEEKVRLILETHLIE